VRGEAIDALRSAAGKTPDAELIRLLRDRMQNDSSSYIRLQSAAAMRQIGSREPY
jgi:HEAT repeat protein